MSQFRKGRIEMEGTIIAGILYYFIRHGQHVANQLTAQGIEGAVQAGKAIAADLAKRGIDVKKVLMCSSQEPRAVQTAGIIAAILGVRVTGGPLPGFNPARGLADAIKAGKLPKVGEGTMRAWREACPEGMASWKEVQRFTQMTTMFCSPCPDCVHVGGAVIVVSHGGVIEPCIDKLEGADCHDLAEAEVAVVEGSCMHQGTVHFLNRREPAAPTAEPLTCDDAVDPRQ